ncbi:MAG: hypothetical protein WCD81_12455 [Candidatus Bathyarchaeia archaeon]
MIRPIVQTTLLISVPQSKPKILFYRLRRPQLFTAAKILVSFPDLRIDPHTCLLLQESLPHNITTHVTKKRGGL